MLQHYEYSESSKSCLINRKTRRPVGCIGNHGYYQVATRRFGMKLAHRIIWELHNGPIPEGMVIDHIDRNRSNNQLSNLRLVDYSQNSANTDGHSDSKTGHKNISHHKSGYAVEVMRRGVRKRGIAKTIEDSIKLRSKYEEELND